MMSPTSSDVEQLAMYVWSVTVVGVRGHLVAAEPSAENLATLQSLMMIGHADRVEFMG